MNIKFEALNKTNGAFCNVLGVLEKLPSKKWELFSKMEKEKV
jgi:hypothetical protein